MLNPSANEKHPQSPPSSFSRESIWPMTALMGDELGRFMAGNSRLRAYGQHLFSDIYNGFSDHNDLFILGDVNARLITLHSCPETLSAVTESVGLRCGVLLSESSCGTNAIILALRYREPVMSSNMQSWGAVAVPVLDADRQPMACIAILNCADGSLGEKLLLAKFIAREFGKFYKSQSASLPIVSPVIADSDTPASPIPQSDGFKVRQLCDRRRTQRTASPAMLAVGLTARQQQVLMLFAQGMSYKEIARKIGISSYKTVEEHLDAVREKLQVSHRRECIHKAMSLGLL